MVSVIKGALVDDPGAYLGTLTLTALPPYGVHARGDFLATVGGQAPNSTVSVVGSGYMLSPDGTQLLAGSSYSATSNLVHLIETNPACGNSPMTSRFTSAGLTGAALTPIGTGQLRPK